LPAPWTVECIPGGYVVKDATGHAWAYCYGHATFGDADLAKGITLEEARRVATDIAKLPTLLRKKSN